MVLILSENALAELRREAARTHPNECCGILLGTPAHIESILRTANVHPTPRTHFEIDPQTLIDAHRAARSGGPQVAGYYHSHPGGRARPSATDQAMASGDGLIWAIIGEDGIAFWRDGEAGFEHLPYICEEG